MNSLGRLSRIRSLTHLKLQVRTGRRRNKTVLHTLNGWMSGYDLAPDSTEPSKYSLNNVFSNYKHRTRF